MKGIQIHYDRLEVDMPPYYAFDADAVRERFPATASAETPEEMVENHYRTLSTCGLIGHGWSELSAIRQLESKNNAC